METHIDLRLNISPLFLWKNFEAQNENKEIHAYIFLRINLLFLYITTNIGF